MTYEQGTKSNEGVHRILEMCLKLSHPMFPEWHTVPVCAVWSNAFAEGVRFVGLQATFLPQQPHNRLRKRFPLPGTVHDSRNTLSHEGFNLLNGLLQHDPSRRITAEDALQHPWCADLPLSLCYHVRLFKQYAVARPGTLKLCSVAQIVHCAHFASRQMASG